MIKLPFDPAVEWGARERYDVAGSINGQRIRAKLTAPTGRPLPRASHGWCRDETVVPGAQVAVTLALEGPQVGAMAADIAAAFEANPAARHFFESPGDVLPQEFHPLDRERETP